MNENYIYFIYNLILFIIHFHLILLVRTSSVQPTGFFVFHGGDPEVCGIYRVTKEYFGEIPIFVSENGCRLFRQVGMKTDLKELSCE